MSTALGGGNGLGKRCATSPSYLGLTHGDHRGSTRGKQLVRRSFSWTESQFSLKFQFSQKSNCSFRFLIAPLERRDELGGITFASCLSYHAVIAQNNFASLQCLMLIPGVLSPQGELQGLIIIMFTDHAQELLDIWISATICHRVLVAVMAPWELLPNCWEIQDLKNAVVSN